MKFNIPTSWQELNEYQIQKLSVLLFSIENKNTLDYALKLLEILFINKRSFTQYIKYRCLLLQVSYKELLGLNPDTINSIKFLETEPELFNFPKIKKVKEPTKSLASLTIEQYSVVDFIFYQWMKTKKEVFLSQLVASLYALPLGWAKDKMVQVAGKTDRLSLEKKLHIAFIYMNCRNRLVKKYPIVFPKIEEPKPEDDKIIRPNFGTKEKYIPFNQVIIGLAMDSPAPLGNFKQAKETNIFDFFEVFSSSIKRQKAIENARAKTK